MPLLPWPSLLVLGGATFVMVSAEMLPTAVLGELSTGLDVSAARAGLLVSVWAATVVVASFPLVRLTVRWNRRSVVAGALVALAASAGLTAVAPSFAVATGARLLGAAATGLLWSTVNAHTAEIVEEGALARAVSVVLGGATLGIVLGAPLGRLVADVASWRLAFGALAVAALAVAGLVRRVVVPGAARTGDARPSRRGGLGPTVVAASLVGLVLVGHFAAYTFVTRLVAPTAGRVPGGTSGLLLLFGAATALAVVAVGRFGDRRLHAALVATCALLAIALLALVVVGASPLVTVVVVGAWGLTSGALPPLAQTRILRLAGAEHRATAGTVIPVVFNLGIAVGAATGSALVAVGGVAALPVPAAVIAGAGAVALGAALGGGGPRSVGGAAAVRDRPADRV